MSALEKATQAIRNRLGTDSGLATVIKLDFGSDGVILIDAVQVPNQVSNDNKDATCTLLVTLSDFQAMAKGEISPMAAFMDGRLRVEGDMGAAMKLQSLF